MGYFRGLTHGAIIGAALGFLYAPEAGIEIRRRVSRLLTQPEAQPSADAGGAPISATARRRATGGTQSRSPRS